MSRFLLRRKLPKLVKQRYLTDVTARERKSVVHSRVLERMPIYNLTVALEWMDERRKKVWAIQSPSYVRMRGIRRYEVDPIIAEPRRS